LLGKEPVRAGRTLFLFGCTGFIPCRGEQENRSVESRSFPQKNFSQNQHYFSHLKNEKIILFQNYCQLLCGMQVKPFTFFDFFISKEEERKFFPQFKPGFPQGKLFLLYKPGWEDGRRFFRLFSCLPWKKSRF